MMDQLGHTNPNFTLRVYRHAMRRDDGENDGLRRLVAGTDWAEMGTNDDPGRAVSGGSDRHRSEYE